MNILNYYLLLIITLTSLLIFCTSTKVYSYNKYYNNELYKKAYDEETSTSAIAALQLSSWYRNYSLDTSIIVARHAINISKAINNDSLISISEITLAISFSWKDALDSTIKYCNQAIERLPENKTINAAASNTLGVTYRRLSNFKKSESYSLKSIKLYKELTDTTNYASALGNLSTHYQEMGEFEKAINLSLQAAELFYKIGDTNNLAKRYGTIANIYCDLDDVGNGMYYFTKGINLVDKTRYPGLYYNFLFNIATLYHTKQSYDSALLYYRQSIHHYYKVNDEAGIAIAQQNIGLVFIETGDYNKAIATLRDALHLFEQLSTIRNVADVLRDLGLGYQKVGEFDSSEYYFMKSIKISKEYNLIREEQKAYKYLYDLFKHTGSYKQALESYEKYRDINDSLYNVEMRENLTELTSKYESEKKDEQIKQLKLNETIIKQRNRTYAITSISFFLIVVLIIGILYTRKRNQTQLLEVSRRLLESEKTELDTELEFKKKQLTTHALHMTQKNKILQGIRKAVSEIIPHIPDSTRAKVKSLKLELNKSLRYDKDWEVFSIYFNELNQEFFDKLTALNPNLSQNDLRLAALLHMNMNIKEAAAVLNIEPDSVKTARYKLRKKLNLKAEDDLVKFIMKL